ncbi:MAG TPA: hypothetical protein VIF32_05845 [Gemmatimonadaceae bacterium]|jgi:hypothetical protein
MSTRFIALVAGASLTVAGCASDRSITGTPPATALVRFINATNTGMDIAISGLVTTANTNIASLGASACLTINVTTPALTFRNTGTTTDLTGFTANFTATHEYWIVAITGASAATQFVTVDQAFTPTAATTDAGIAGLNANFGGGPYDLHAAVPGTALGAATVKVPNLAFGTASALVNFTIPFNTATPPVAQPLQVQFTGAGNTTVARNHGNVTFVPTTSNLAIIVSGTAATPTTLRSIVNGGC